jgi:hypothetical protein
MSSRPVALFDHCCSIFDLLMQESTQVEEDFIYTGFTTKLFAKARLSTPYYTAVMRELIGMGCVEQLRRGGGGAPSQWKLLTRPTRALWDAKEGRSKPIKSHNLDQVIQMLTALNERVAWLYQYLGVPNKEDL